MKVIDLRSDTVTLPTREMLESIQTASLGDDKRGGGDPTVKRLERLAAEKMGKEDAILVPSGTMGNLISILGHTEWGEQVILERNHHSNTSECGTWSILGGLFPVPIDGKLGYMDPNDVANAIRLKKPKTGLILNENTFNHVGGIALTPEEMKTTWEVAIKHDLPVHLDGARIFNAAVYLGVDVKKFTKYADSIMFCLSKGLSAPVGSIVCGTEEFIVKLRYFRNMLGGGMRQAGIIAAPGIIALTKMVERLKEDHETMAMLAKGIGDIKGIKLLHPVQTNIMFIDMVGLGISSVQFEKEMAKVGIKIMLRGGSIVRFVTHRGIDKEDIAYVIQCVKNISTK